VIALVTFEPLIAKEPVQPPDAVQAVALVEDQVSVEVAPLVTLVGLALSETLGRAAETETVALWAADPPAPVHVSVYRVVAVNAAVLAEPLVALEPLQPPVAAQEVALVDDHVSVEAAPLATVLGLPDSVTAGAA
jgi:hypothetical protein